MSSGVVGRDEELASLRDFASSIADGVAALALEGDAGAGKTTLWTAGIAAAEAVGCRVLTARPAESEIALSFSAIGDLLDPVLEQALAPLSTGQHQALSRALVLDDDDGPPPDPHAIGVALLTSFRALADHGPVVVAVDDVQWLDTASAGGLAYAARRLTSERVGLLLSRRSGLESTLLVELERALPDARIATLHVGPLHANALHHMVQAKLGVVLARPLLSDVQEASGGNPFYALEIVRTMLRGGTAVDAGRRLPVPESLHDLVRDRLLELPPGSRDFLLAAAAHAHPTVSVSETASRVDRASGLDPAVAAGVVELDGPRIRFTHPLLSAAAYESADRRRRAEIHARLAELLDDPEARAWQLAASVDAPDEAVGAALEQAANHAQRRGALRAAALMLDRASEVTPAERRDDFLRRARDAAYLHFESGDSRLAEARLRALIAPLPAGPDRARATVVLARIRLYEAPDEAAELFAQVIEEAGDDRATLAIAHEGMAASCAWLFERFEDVLHHSGIALGLADELVDDALAADVIMVRLSAELLLGRSTASQTAERAEALQSSAANRRVMDQPLVSLVEYWNWIDLHERARTVLVDLVQRAHDMGDENAAPWLLFLLGDADRRLGNLAVGLEHAREGREAAEQSGQHLFARHNLALEGLIQAQLGRAEQTYETAGRAFAETRDHYGRMVAAEALAHLALVRGSPDEVVEYLAPRVAFVREQAIVEPGAARFAIDLIEALVELGQREEALEVLDWYEGNARRVDRASARAGCLRCRGLLEAQAGDLDVALRLFEEALTWHAKVDIPLDRGRTLLALGSAQRRAKRRREARSTLEQALVLFEQIGAALWAERAREELRRISGRAPTAGALTPAEQRVAALVAEGKTNAEVGAALFLSDRTVEGHLSRIYAKLGIRHRTELARALASGQSQGVASSNTRDTPVSADSPAP